MPRLPVHTHAACITNRAAVRHSEEPGRLDTSAIAGGVGNRSQEMTAEMRTFS